MTTPAPHHAFTPAEQLDEFVRRVKPALDQVANYHHGPMGGHEWRWSTPAGVWALYVGGAIDAGPLVIGPGGNHWHTTGYALQHADLVLLMLQLAGALEGPGRPIGAREVDARPVVAQVGGQHWQAPPTGVGPGVPVAGSDLRARGDDTGDLNVGKLVGTLADRLADDPTGVDLVDESGTLRRFPTDGNIIRLPAGTYRVPAAAPARPASRQPGANTGIRPVPGFAGRGPGAAYTPTRIQDGDESVGPVG